MKKQIIKKIIPLLAVLIAYSFFGAISVSFADQTVMAQDIPIPKPPTGSTTPPLDPSQTVAAQEKALNIIQNVLSVDLTKYTLELDSCSIMDAHPLTNDNRKITTLRYLITPVENPDNENNIRIYFNIENNVVTSYYISPVASQIITNTQYTNQRNAITGFLEKYQAFTHIDSSNLITMLNDVDLTQSSTITHENMKLVVSADSLWGIRQINLRWTYTANGADYNALEISVNAVGFVTYLYDDRALYTIGNTSVNISLEQAVDIAIANLGSYSYVMPDGSVVRDFRVDRDATLPVLCVVSVDYELRPYWDVSLYLDEVYPGSVFGIKVFIWADTGEIISYGNMAMGGVYDTGDAAVSGAGLGSSSPDNTWVFVVAAIVAVAVAVLAIGLVVKKRHK